MKISSIIGQCFILGFSGHRIPAWLHEFSERFELGGALLFDSPPQREGNFNSPESLKQLACEVRNLNGRPIVSVDQEGGAVQRLHHKNGFCGLASAKRRAQQTEDEHSQQLDKCYQEMSSLGIHLNFSPCVDLDKGDANPNISKLERAFGPTPQQVIAAAQLEIKIAQKHKVHLCLKHYPGLSSATTDSHREITWIEPNEDDLLPFHQLCRQHPHLAIMMSHGVYTKWSDHTCSTSARAYSELKKYAPTTLTITDDLQMLGLRKKMDLYSSVVAALSSGADMVCLANTSINEETQMVELAQRLSQNTELGSKLEKKLTRIQSWKTNSPWE